MSGGIFIILGTSHKTAPIAVREKAAVSSENEAEFLKDLVAGGEISEAAALSTCNRTEIYAAAENPETAFEKIENLLSESHGVSKKELEGNFYRLSGMEAVKHLFSVVAGLDSMLTGETEIKAQAKSAFESARENGTIGKTLHLLFERAFKSAKKVHSLPGAGRGKVSLAAVGVALVEKELGTLRGKSALIIGSGLIGAQSAIYFREKGVSEIFTANRTPSKADALAEKVGGRAVTLRELDSILPKVDVVVGCTSAKDPVLHRSRCMDVISARSGRKLVILDLGVPRNVEPSAAEVKGIRLFDIDMLGSLAEENLESRKSAAEKGAEIVLKDAETAFLAVSGADRGELVKRVLEKFEDVRAAEVERSASRPGNLGEKERAEIERMTKRIIGKILHQPLEELKKPRPEEETRKILEALDALLK